MGVHNYISSRRVLIQLHFSMRVPLTFLLTTPPTPNAGTILHILATALIPQFFLMMPHLSPQVTTFPFMLGLLYRSKPRRCIGVLSSCTLAGATNCAIVAPLRLLLNSSVMPLSIIGPSKGGRLKEAKMVRQSLAANKT